MNVKIKDSLTEKIIACCFKVHSELGPGFKERIYQNAVKIVLEEAGLNFSTEKQYAILFLNKKIGVLRLDLVVEDKIVLELKSLTGSIPEVFKYQVISYLKAAGLKTGLLINFGNKSCQINRYVL